MSLEPHTRALRMSFVWTSSPCGRRGAPNGAVGWAPPPAHAWPQGRDAESRADGERADRGDGAPHANPGWRLHGAVLRTGGSVQGPCVHQKAGIQDPRSSHDTRLLIVESQKPEASREAQLERLAAVHGVREVRERAIKRPSNDVSAGLMGAPVVMGKGFNLSGEGETICVCDTGIDTGDPATIHPDFTGRIVAIRSFPITPDFTSFVNNPGANDGPAIATADTARMSPARCSATARAASG